MIPLLLRFCRGPVLLLVLAALGAQAQPLLPVSALSADPARATTARPTAARGTQALPLPFFDDFVTPLDGSPDAAFWQPGGGAYVSNRFALMPLTRGTATFDALKANGSSYSGQITNYYDAIDSLTSQPINLSGLTAASAVYLSFARQAGGLIGNPTPSSRRTPVYLRLYFKTAAGTWNRVWADSSKLDMAGTRTRTVFRQAILPIDQAQYLHGDFQFRFVATGNASVSIDIWNVDYVLLDRSRSPADTTYIDVATGAGLPGRPAAGLTNPLRRYSAMPAWQYSAAATPASELSPQLGVSISNLNGGVLATGTSYVGTVRELGSGATLGTWLTGNRPVPLLPRQSPLTGDATTVPLPGGSAAKTIRYELVISANQVSSIPRTFRNDTIFRDVTLGDHYAYDDGTAEAFTQLQAASTGPPSYLAYRFATNKADQVSGLRIYPVFTTADVLPRPITISVWADANGKPDNTPLATKSLSIPYTPTRAGYVDLAFDTPVPVDGIFYVGYGQAALSRDLHYGLDLNSSFPAGSLWLRTAGAWDSTRLAIRSSLMMRAVMNNNVLATSAPRTPAAFALYPNPGRGTVRVAGPAFRSASVLDALGRTVWTQPAAEAGQLSLPLGSLPTGLYLVRLALPDGRTLSQRLVLE